MNQDFIEQLIGILERSSLTELEYSEGGSRIRLTQGMTGSTPPIVATPVAVTGISSPARPAGLATAAADSTETKTGAAGKTISAPLTGIFYRSPSPGQPAFVQVGDIIEDGQQLGIIEAMKMLNSVEADCAGRVVRIVSEDGASVEGGAVLFMIEPVEG